MSFLSDLKEGESFELKVQSFMNKWYDTGLIKNPDKTGVDLIAGSLTIETKLDKKSSETGNMFVEFECNGKPSGIFKYENMSFFVCGTNEGTLVFTSEELQKIVKDAQENKTYRIAKGGDGWRVSGLLIPLQVAKQLCSRVFQNV